MSGVAPDPPLTVLPGTGEWETFVREVRRCADETEMTGDGPLEPILADPHGCGERELRARIRRLQAALDRLDGLS